MVRSSAISFVLTFEPRGSSLVSQDFSQSCNGVYTSHLSPLTCGNSFNFTISSAGGYVKVFINEQPVVIHPWSLLDQQYYVGISSGIDSNTFGQQIRDWNFFTSVASTKQFSLDFANGLDFVTYGSASKCPYNFVTELTAVI